MTVVSLADELNDERPQRSSIIDDWLAEWYPTLSDADKVTFDRAVLDPRQPISALYRVCKRHGFTGSDPHFRKWVVTRRAAS